jgi:hypothetical protein
VGFLDGDLVGSLDGFLDGDLVGSLEGFSVTGLAVGGT